jgi:cell division protein FtsA
MAKPEIFTGVDVGSTTVRVVVAQRAPGGELTAVGACEVPAQGVSKGVVTSIDETVSALSEAFERVERMVGVPIERATVGISGSHVITQESHGVVAVAKADGEIGQADVTRVLEAAQTVAVPPNYELLHVIPKSFTVDNQAGIKDPVGMVGVRLEVQAQIIMCQAAPARNLTKCVYRTGVDIDELVFSVLATAGACLNRKQRELGVALVNIGGATTSLAVYEEGDIVHSAVLPIGAGHVTADLAIGLRTAIDVAEQIKLNYGHAQAKQVPRREDIDLTAVEDAGATPVRVSRQQVAEIIEARMEELYKLVDKELRKVGRSGLLPAGVVLTGGGAKLPGAVDLAKDTFRLPAFLGLPLDLRSPIDKLHDCQFTTAVGLAQWMPRLESRGVFPGNNKGHLAAVGDITSRMRGWLRSLLP